MSAPDHIAEQARVDVSKAQREHTPTPWRWVLDEDGAWGGVYRLAPGILLADEALETHDCPAYAPLTGGDL